MKAQGNPSANGAKYESQGQARSASPLGNRHEKIQTLKERNNSFTEQYFALSMLAGFNGPYSRGDARRFAPLLPLAFIFRAFGARTQDSDETSVLRKVSSRLRQRREIIPPPPPPKFFFESQGQARSASPLGNSRKKTSSSERAK